MSFFASSGHLQEYVFSRQASYIYQDWQQIGIVETLFDPGVLRISNAEVGSSCAHLYHWCGDVLCDNPTECLLLDLYFHMPRTRDGLCKNCQQCQKRKRIHGLLSFACILNKLAYPASLSAIDI